MRDFKGMKRQRGRNRGGGGGGGGKPQQHNANRAFDSNGPDGVKVRGNAQHVFEKYQQLARDATSSGDRVLAENYLQHAEHYFRLIRATQPNRPASEIIGRDQFASGYDIDFEDESGLQQAIAADEAAENNEAREDGEGRDQGQNRDQNRNRDRDRGEWQARDRDDRPRDRDRDRDRDRGDGNRDRWRDRDDRPRDRDRDRNRNRDDRPRDDRPRGEGEDRPRDDRPPREDRPRFERNRDRDDRPERDPLAVVQPQGDAPQAEAPAPSLRDDAGEHSNVPAFLRPTRPVPVVEAAAEEKPKAPRRRRAPRSFEGGEGAPAPAESEE